MTELSKNDMLNTYGGFVPLIGMRLFVRVLRRLFSLI